MDERLGRHQPVDQLVEAAAARTPSLRELIDVAAVDRQQWSSGGVFEELRDHTPLQLSAAHQELTQLTRPLEGAIGGQLPVPGDRALGVDLARGVQFAAAIAARPIV